MQVLVDALTFTDRERFWDEWANELGITNLSYVMSKSRYQFTFHLYAKGVNIYQAGDAGDTADPNRMCCIELSGTGCRLLESLNPGFDWMSFLLRLHASPSVHISRLDIAGDETEGFLTFKRLYAYTRSRRYITRARKCKYIDGDEQEVLFGSGKSDTLLRIYNKALERGITDGTHWTRAEFQFRNDQAGSFVANLANQQDIGKTYAGVLLNYLRYTTKAPDENNNNQRIPTASWWSDFLGTAERLTGIYAPGLEYNRERLDRNMHNYGSTIKTYLAVYGGDLDKVADLAANSVLNAGQADFLRRLEITSSEATA